MEVLTGIRIFSKHLWICRIHKIRSKHLSKQTTWEWNDKFHAGRIPYASGLCINRSLQALRPHDIQNRWESQAQLQPEQSPSITCVNASKCSSRQDKKGGTKKGRKPSSHMKRIYFPEINARGNQIHCFKIIKHTSGCSFNSSRSSSCLQVNCL